MIDPPSTVHSLIAVSSASPQIPPTEFLPAIATPPTKQSLIVELEPLPQIPPTLLVLLSGLPVIDPPLTEHSLIAILVEKPQIPPTEELPSIDTFETNQSSIVPEVLPQIPPILLLSLVIDIFLTVQSEIVISPSTSPQIPPTELPSLVIYPPLIVQLLIVTIP